MFNPQTTYIKGDWEFHWKEQLDGGGIWAKTPACAIRIGKHLGFDSYFLRGLETDAEKTWDIEQDQELRRTRWSRSKGSALGIWLKQKYTHHF